jgi:DUF1680 family protein
LTGGPLKHAQDLDAEYLLKLQPDRMLAYFRDRAGLEPKAHGYGGWDGDGKNLTGHIAGHYLSAVSLMWAATGDSRFKARADYLVKELEEVQDKNGDGYLGALAGGRQRFAEVARGDIRSGGFDLNGLWSPWYVLHKMFAGLRDAYRYTGNRTALNMEIKFAAWAEGVVGKLNDAQIQKMLGTEFGGMNEVLAELYEDTGDKRWLALSDRFEHRAIVDPLARHDDILNGKHGNTQVPKLLGSLERYLASGNAVDGAAARFFWDEVALHHSFATGGHGKDEYFGPPDKLNAHIDGRTAESCNVYNMLKMTRRLFALQPDVRYAEFQERALFNHVLGSIDPQDGWTCYMVPVGRGVQREYERNMLDGGFTCCVGTGMENHALHGDGIYYEAGDKLWVNLYAPSRADWKAKGVKLEMETGFPEGETASLKVNVNAPTEFTLALRRPLWAGEGFNVKVNGQVVDGLPKPGSYVELKRIWTSGDTVALVLPKKLHIEPLADNPNRVALLWGPLVLAGDVEPDEARKKSARRDFGPERAGVPIFLAAGLPIETWLKPVPGKPGTFRTDHVGRDRDVDFMPFYRLHRRAYAVYWDLFTPEAWQKQAAEYAAQQEKARKLEAATVAYAQPGEMQPERDFNFQGEETEVVRLLNRPGRQGAKWFSFDMPIDPAHAMALVVTYTSDERKKKTFEVLVDGHRLKEQTIEKSDPPRFFDVEYAIPPDVLQGKKKLTVRFQATQGNEIGSVFGVRMIRLSAAQQLFPQGSVRLLDGPFKEAQEADHAYLIRLEPDRLLAQFRIEAGLTPKAKPYGGWESPAQPGKTWSLAGHTLGHYLSACSQMYCVTDDQRLKERIAYIARELKFCQDKRGDGSLVAFPLERELEADIRAGKVETIDKYWAPFYTIHKEMAGLRDAWLLCGDATAREVMLRMADWCGSLVKDLPEERRQRMLDMEHGGMAEVLADSFAISGNKKYLDYARQYSHRAVLDPFADGIDNLTGKHANTQIPKFIGFQRIHELSGDPRYGAAASFFWKTVVQDRTWVNGGNSIHEHFPDPKNMGECITQEGGPETCNTYNMLKLTEALYREQPQPAYLEYYENALFNHILTSQAPLAGAGAFVYYTPLRPDFARAYGNDFGCFWCCTGTGMENHARYGTMIYSHDEAAISVNLFIASELKSTASGMGLRQETRFPDETGTTLVVISAPADAMTIRIRRPSWLASAKMSIAVNGEPVEASSQSGGYVELKRKWSPGDRVHVDLPMKLHVVRQPQSPGWVSLFNGPILLAGELGSEGLTQADYIGGYLPVKALRPLEKAPVFVAQTDDDILARIAPLPGQPGKFRTAGLVKPTDVTLAPFFRVHFERYAIYWKLTDLAHWEELERRISEAGLAERELAARTVDQVRIGEQQPEIDHNLRFEHSQSNMGPQGRRWRDAQQGGWFGYDMKLPPTRAKTALRVMYWGQDGGRKFDIQVDGKLLVSQELTGGRDGYFAIEYPIADVLTAGKHQVAVRILAPPGNAAGPVYDLRIVTVK